MAVRVNVVVTCTERKTQEPPSALMLRSVPAGSIASRALEWQRRLEVVDAPATRALELYTGNHWFIVRSIAAQFGVREDLDVRVWVASAGYGLVPLDAPLRPYAATFAAGPDGVGGSDDSRRWWQALAESPVPGGGQPRTLEALAAADPHAPLLVAASAVYARAIQHDLTRAAERLSSPDLLVLISAGLRATRELAPYLVSTDARFRQVVGGQLHSLNARLVQHALERWRDWAPDGLALRRMFGNAAEGLPPLPIYDRDPQSDDAVRSFIRNAKQEQPTIGHTALLRRLRAGGRACEQKRFKALFQQVINESST